MRRTDNYLFLDLNVVACIVLRFQLGILMDGGVIGALRQIVNPCYSGLTQMFRHSYIKTYKKLPA